MYKLYLEKNISSKELLTKILEKENVANIEIVYNEHGKPYLKNNELYFNLSHDRNMTVLVTSNQEIGVDLEYLTYKQSVVNKYFIAGKHGAMDVSAWTSRKPHFQQGRTGAAAAAVCFLRF